MIQPIDIKTQKFKKGLFGYKASEVDSFINIVYREYEELFKENKELSDNLEKLNASLQENRLKMFDLESKLQSAEGVGSYGDDKEAKKRADEIIRNAEKAAAEIIANAKKESSKLEGAADTKADEAEAPKSSIKFTTAGSTPKKPAPVNEEPKESASSRFFKKVEEEAVTAGTAASSVDEDDDEIFVGEIEDSRKPDRMMIGDGEEEEEMDFEFL